MANRMDTIPEWILKPTGYDDPVDIHELIQQVNFLKGSYVGHSSKIDELEEKFSMAIDYQREIDARIVEEVSYIRYSASIQIARTIREGKE